MSKRSVQLRGKAFESGTIVAPSLYGTILKWGISVCGCGISVVICRSCLRGEAANLSESVVDDWGRRLESVCKGYQLRDIFIVDETGLFYQLCLPSQCQSKVRKRKVKGNLKRE